MTAEEWREVKAVLRQAMNIPEAERRVFMDTACADQPALRREVESLLAAHEAEVVAGDPLPDVLDAMRRAETGLVRNHSADELRATLQAGLGEQFDVLGMLGSGAMGAIFLAQERALDRMVAIKVLLPDHAATAGSRERFRREARIAAQLSHAGIVPLHAFGEVNGLCYFVMEYVRGSNLAQRLENETTLPADEVLRVFLAIAEALEHAHQRGVIHRDIKPANILLDQDSGQPRLADFGISTFADSSDSLTMTGAIVGTPLFMSPEQADGETELDGRSDIYSLGAVAYAMLTGRAPFTGPDARAVLLRRRFDDVTPILELVPRLPTDLAHIVMRCLERDRALRWRDAAALCSALRNSGNVQASDLPEVIADLPGYAMYAVTWLALWTAFAFGTARSTTSRAILLLVAILVPVGPALHVWRVRAHGMRASQLMRLVLRPPKWWGTWWPSSLRAPDDLWSMMPPIARVIRVLVAMCFGLLIIVALTADGVTATQKIIRNASAALLLTGVPIATLAVWRWGAQQKLGFDDAVQFLFFSTAASTFWRQPRIARLLAPATHAVRPPDSLVAADHARAVEELIRRFPSTFAPIGHTVSGAVQHQIAAIAALDRELALLARDSSPAEVNRLTTRLSLLSEHAEASPEHRELAETVRRQVDLMRRIQGQHTLAQARRSTLLAQLQAMWSQARALVDAECDGESAVRQAKQRVLALSARLVEGGDVADRKGPNS